jgi:sec-independent protein translocase protein TatA
MGTGLLQPTHIIFVIAIALLVFGPKKLPEMGRSIGNGIREFKESMDGNSSPSEPAVHHNEATSDAPAAAPVHNRVADLPPAAAAPIHAPVEPRTPAASGPRVSR